MASRASSNIFDNVFAQGASDGTTGGWVRKIPPGAPLHVHIVRASHQEIEVGWRAPAPIKGASNEPLQGYEISYAIEGAKPKRRLLDGMTESVIVRGLRPGQAVKGILVKARNDYGWGPQSFPEITGRATSAPPGKVEWVEVVETTAFTATLRWSKPLTDNGAKIENYKIRQNIPGVPSSDVEFETGTEESEYVCGGLQPGTPYLFHVAAQNESGWGAWVRLPAFGLTKSAPPNKPTDFKIDRTAVSFVQVSWKKPYSNGGPVLAYEIVYEDDVGKLCSKMLYTGADEAKEIHAKDEESLKIDNLMPGSLLLSLTIRAKNDAGWGPFCAPIFASTSGETVNWGTNSHGQLGDKEVYNRCGVASVDSLNQMHVTVVSAGGLHSAVVCSGEVYTWGSNDRGQLGRYGGDVDTEAGPVRIRGYESQHTGSANPGVNDTLFMYPNLQVLKQDGPMDYLGSLGALDRTAGYCKSVACGRAHTIILTTLGEMFTFGEGTHGALGHGNMDSLQLPRMVDFLSSKGLVVEAVWCGNDHSACLVEGGHALTWGCGLDGQLGHSSRENQLYPRKVEHLRSSRVTWIACGAQHTAFVTSDGEIYTCGEGRDGRLGHGDDKSYLYPKKIDSLSEVSRASCGAYHTACIAMGRNLFTWGNGSDGQLGHMHVGVNDMPLFSTLGQVTQGAWHQRTPRCVTQLGRNTEAGGVLQVECSVTCTVAVTCDFGLWVWGQGPQVEALVGPSQVPHLPVRVGRFLEDYIWNLSVGPTHVLAVMAKYPPGAEQRLDEAAHELLDSDSKEVITEVIVESLQEAVFWATRMGYPLMLGATEHTLRMYMDGTRGKQISQGVCLCYSEPALRREFKALHLKEAQRLSKDDQTPKLMLAVLQQDDAGLTEEEREARDKTMHELKATRLKQQEEDEKRMHAMALMRKESEENEAMAAGTGNRPSRAASTVTSPSRTMSTVSRR